MALQDSLVAYYKMDGNSNDAVGSNNGTDTAMSYATANGKINQGGSFNGTTGKIDLSGMSVGSGSPHCSFAAWIKCANGITGWIIQLETAGNGDTLGLNMTGIGGGRSSVQYIAGGSNVISGAFNSTAPIDDGNWHHIVGVTVQDGTPGTGREAHIYIDGVLDATAGVNIATVTPTSAAIGYDRRNNNTFFTGSIDEIGVWSRPLTADEVLALYYGGTGLQYPFYRSGGAALLPLML